MYIYCMSECLCACKRVGWRGAGRVAYSKSMPQIVVRCRSPSAMRFGQEGNVIGFVQSSWQPAPADICSLLTTQTYLHQGTHTRMHEYRQVHTVAQHRHMHTPIHTVTHTTIRVLVRGKGKHTYSVGIHTLTFMLVG